MAYRLGTFVIAALTWSTLAVQTNRTRNAAADWPMYNRDLAGTRYSPLAEINTKNVAKLTEAWSFKLGAPGPAGGLRGDVQEPEVEAGARGARGRVARRRIRKLHRLSSTV